MKKKQIIILGSCLLGLAACKGKFHSPLQDSVNKVTKSAGEGGFSVKDTAGLDSIEAAQDSAAGIDNNSRN